MKKKPAFHFKKFRILQNINPQKVGTDSMLLGAWSSGNYSRILDIGTGTGILALMAAQLHPSSEISAIEPDTDSLEEAKLNFESSPFSKQIKGLHSNLQEYQCKSRFDLIISNPPYFENSTLSADHSKNKARHTIDLPVEDLYKFSAQLLNPNGNLNLIFPHDLESLHFSEAQRQNLFPAKILRTKKENGEFKRTLVSYSFKNEMCDAAEMIVKYSDNRYSREYIELTKEFYATDLAVSSY